MDPATPSLADMEPLRAGVAGCRRTETELRARVAQLQSQVSELEHAYAHAPVGLCLMDAELRFVRVNERLAAINGTAAAKHIGRTLREVIPALAQEIEAVYRTVLASGEPMLDLEVEGVTPTDPGHRRAWLCGYYPLKSETGAVRAVTTAVLDITDRKRAEETLRESEARFRSAFDHSAIGMALQDTAGRYLRVNDALCTMLGYTAEDLLATTFDVITHPDDREADRRENHRVLAGEISWYQMEKRYHHKRGHVIWVLVNASLVRDPQGHPLYFVVQVQDITERKYAELALRESEQRYRMLAENVGDVILTFDRNRCLTDISPSVARFRGYSAEEILARPPEARLTGRSLAELTRVLREEGAREATRSVGDSGQTRTIEVELPHKDGSTVWAEVKISVLRDSAGRLSGFLGVSRDITERRQAEQQLRLQAAALAAAANAIIITDREGVIQWVNPAFTSLTGYAATEVLGKTPRHLKSGQHGPAFYETLWQTILSGQVWQGELTNRRRDGTLYTESETITPVRDGSGAITHFIAIKLDVTAQKRAEAELQHQRDMLHQTEKIAAMGQLLAGVAHELNNPLAVVIGQAYLLQQQAAGSPLAHRSDKIAQAAERCARIVKNFLALARQYPPERQEVSLTQVVREGLELLAYPLRVDNVEVIGNLAPDLPPIWADPHQLQQVVVNLVANAHQALREVPCDRRQLTLTTCSRPDGAGVRLEVVDTGPGITPEVRRRLFEPFFTTKPPGQGTGLGLSLCHAIIEGHGGTMGEESEPGQGARFWVELPIGAPAKNGVDSAAVESAAPLTGQHILVVDDETEVATLLAELLVQDGHQVDRAANGVVALEKLRSREYDLIVCDLRMPGLDGPGLYRELERRNGSWRSRFVFVTGDVLSPDAKVLFDTTRVPTLSKPFTADQVRRVVQGVLQRTKTLTRESDSVARGHQG